jgi:hypothetical protein
VSDLLKNLDLIQNIRLESIVITESDDLQQASVLENLLTISEKVFSNNLVGSSKRIFPLPLGLERQTYRSAGNLKDFKKIPNAHPRTRPINFLIAWNDDTNSNRKQVRDIFRKSSRTINFKRRLNAKSVHKLMRKTLFVPSPAGNGLDCHRTWEALYLGCVPVVLEADFCGDSTWPVLVVKNWRDLALLKQEELIQIYSSFKESHLEPTAFTKLVLDRI